MLQNVLFITCCICAGISGSGIENSDINTMTTSQQIEQQHIPSANKGLTSTSTQAIKDKVISPVTIYIGIIR